MNRETAFSEGLTELISVSIELWIVVGLIIIFIIIGLIFRGKCPKCGHYRSFKKTGAKRKDGGEIFGKKYYEYCCIKCGFSDWREKYNDESGDGAE